MISKEKDDLLFIEPKEKDKLSKPINDELTELMEMALLNAKVCERYKGWHRTDCGEKSSACNYRLENGMKTNSLAPFYLRWYRYSIPESEMLKLKELETFYKK